MPRRPTPLPYPAVNQQGDLKMDDTSESKKLLQEYLEIHTNLCCSEYLEQAIENIISDKFQEILSDMIGDRLDDFIRKLIEDQYDSVIENMNMKQEFSPEDISEDVEDEEEKK
jgi:hypothetical protein